MHFLQICRCSGEHGKDCNSEPASRSLIKASELYSVVAFTVIKGRLWRPFLFLRFLCSILNPFHITRLYPSAFPVTPTMNTL